MKLHIELSQAEFSAWYLSKWKIDLSGIDYDVLIVGLGEPAAPKPKLPDIPVLVPTPTAPSGFTKSGIDTPIKGKWTLTSEALGAIAVGSFAPYAKYSGAIIEDSEKYGINPIFVLANLANQAVNPEYNNPWGISVDNYPHGPNGSQLGQPNGHVPNGPRKFSDSEWRIAFDRQFSVVASGEAYAKAKTIKEWALIDAPPGAENDVHGTNAREAEDVGQLYDKLVEKLLS